ncbi:coiled-coil domain-containing protein 124-like isoform X1 [Varroa destructor]|uniref:Coiled-coil domain-containing protein n=2 Tax=Varroa destructor TaxID=109461 RepID=A0A7M7L1N6_VARDE|nr:coiled-coil domain-containing protein 124-like isoform X1 [Varroa destructor]
MTFAIVEFLQYPRSNVNRRIAWASAVISNCGGTMPKKLQTNQKAVDARARKDALKQAEKERMQKAKDDEYWRDDDKQLAKKQARKEEKERKEAEERERKKEREKLLQEEMSQMKGKESADKKSTSNKMTRSQIEKNLANIATANAATQKDNRVVQEDLGLVENLNKMAGTGEGAHTLDDAIKLMSKLNTSGEADFDRHPERRLKVAWQAFESARLPVVKAENPNLRLSQLRQMIRKEWQKSSANPLNQRILAYNARRDKPATNDSK